MFAYAIWDEPAQELVCARDRFGIKPFYYAVVGDILYFASEAKALLPMLPSIETDLDGLKDYLAFQFCLAGKTLFKGVRELQPGHLLRVRRGGATPQRYWEVFYEVDFEHTEALLRGAASSSSWPSRFASTCAATCQYRAYLSGGVDSSAVASLAAQEQGRASPRSPASSPRTPATTRAGYARLVAAQQGLDLNEVDIGVTDFVAQHRAASRTTWTIRRPGPDRSRSTWSRTAAAAAGQGDPRRAGRRRDLRRLRPLSDRLFRAVHQGRDRRHAARRQLRRHLRVDHSQPGRRCGTTSR